MPKIRALPAIVLLTVCLALPSIGQTSTTATDAIQATVDQVLEVLKNKSAPIEQRRERIRDLVRERFDFELMSRSTLGRQWKSASEEEQQTFIELYSKLLEATYIGRIDEYSGEKVSYDGQKVRGDKALVETNIVTESVKIPIEYKMVQNGSTWNVYDVVIEGVSLIRNFRSSYGTIIDNEGFPGLFERMRNKIRDLEANHESSRSGSKTSAV